MAFVITDTILVPYSSSSPYADPTQGCVAYHFPVIKGFVVNRHFLIIIKTKWPLCSVSPPTMKNFADVFPTPKD